MPITAEKTKEKGGINYEINQKNHLQIKGLSQDVGVFAPMHSLWLQERRELIMKKVFSTIIAIIMLAGVAYLVWTFKWWIVGGATVLSLFNMAFKGITGRNTKLFKHFEKQGK